MCGGRRPMITYTSLPIAGAEKQSERETMPKTAVLYASGFTKNTQRIAEYISSKTGAETFDLKKNIPADLNHYDTIIFGTGVHAGKPYAPVQKFISDNREILKNKKVKLFITCMYNDEKGKNQCARISGMWGIPDAVFFNKKEDRMNADGIPVSVDEFIKGLRCRFFRLLSLPRRIS